MNVIIQFFANHDDTEPADAYTAMLDSGIGFPISNWLAMYPNGRVSFVHESST